MLLYCLVLTRPLCGLQLRLRKFICIWFTENDVIDEYRQDGPHTVYVESQNIQRVFPGYPHSRVDAAYVEENNQNEYTFSLFRGKKIWQYKVIFRLVHGNGNLMEFVPWHETVNLKFVSCPIFGNCTSYGKLNTIIICSQHHKYWA